MFRAIVEVSVRTRALLSRAPTNLLLAWLGRRDRLRLGVPFMLLGAAYWAAAVLLAAWIRAGAPDWLNLLVLLAFWNGAKFLAFGPYSLALLIVARIREAADRRRAARRRQIDTAEAAVG